MPQLLQMSDKAPSPSSSSPNSCISSPLDTERDNNDNRSRRIGDPAEAEKAEKAPSSAVRVPGETAEAATDTDASGRPAVAAAAVQSQLNHYARGLIMVQK